MWIHQLTRCNCQIETDLDVDETECQKQAKVQHDISSDTKGYTCLTC